MPTRHARIANTTTTTSGSSIITLADASAPTNYAFTFSLPKGAELYADGNGGYDVLRPLPHGVAVGIGHPWAKDATGKALSTTFSRSGNTLTQHIDTAGAQYPISADPHYTWGWVTGTVYYNKSETNNMRSSYFVTGSMCAGLIYFTPVAVAVCGVMAGAIAYQANAAYNAGKCLKIKYQPVNVATLVPGIYSGGYCT